jgi:hypothetical protein
MQYNNPIIEEFHVRVVYKQKRSGSMEKKILDKKRHDYLNEHASLDHNAIKGYLVI